MRFSQVAYLDSICLCLVALCHLSLAQAPSDERSIATNAISLQNSSSRFSEQTLFLDLKNPSDQGDPNEATDSKRRIELRILFPLEKSSSSTILFLSHLGGGIESYRYLGEHWAGRGFACIFLFHGDEVDQALEKQSLAERIQSVPLLANPTMRRARAKEVIETIATLQQWSSTPGHELDRRFDWTRFGIAGHGFGADVGLDVLEGLREAKAVTPKALCVLGPTPLSAEEQKRLSAMACVPGLIVSGDLDESLIRRPDPLRRNGWFASYPECADRYELRFLDGKHYDFTGTPLRFGRPERNPEYHPLIQRVTTLFFQAHVEENHEARKALAAPEIPAAVRPTVQWHLMH